MTNARLRVHAGCIAFGGSLSKCASDLLRWKRVCVWRKAAESSFETRTSVSFGMLSRAAIIETDKSHPRGSR